MDLSTCLCFFLDQSPVSYTSDPAALTYRVELNYLYLVFLKQFRLLRRIFRTTLVVKMLLHDCKKLRIGDQRFLGIIETLSSQQRLALVTYKDSAVLQHHFE